MRLLDPIDLATSGLKSASKTLTPKVKTHMFTFGTGANGAYRNDPQWWQKGYGPPRGDAVLGVSTVYSCVKIIAEETARIDLAHLINMPEKGFVRTNQSAPAQVLRNPNNYQTRSDFILYLMLQLLKDGNSYAFATRDARGAVSELHPLPARSATPHVVPDTGEVFYHFSQFDLTRHLYEDGTMIPARDILHLRLFTPTHPLIGMSPIMACALALDTHQSINGQTSSFFQNMSRSAGLLTTPKPLNPDYAKRLKQAWEEAKTGGTPILDNDIKYQQFQMTAVESEVIKHFDLSDRQIANVYRIPLDFLGLMERATYNNVEQFQKRFILSTLGFYLEHLECWFDKFFGLPATQAIKFDLDSALMRPDFADRMDALSKGITGGVMTPNEARLRENLPPVEGGDNIYMQRQNWPIDLLGEDAEAPGGSDESTQESDPEPEENMLGIVDIKNYLDERVRSGFAA